MQYEESRNLLNELKKANDLYVTSLNDAKIAMENAKKTLSVYLNYNNSSNSNLSSAKQKIIAATQAYLDSKDPNDSKTKAKDLARALNAAENKGWADGFFSARTRTLVEKAKEIIEIQEEEPAPAPRRK